MTPDPVVAAVALSALVIIVAFLGSVLGLFLAARNILSGIVSSAIKAEMAWVPEFRAAVEREREQRIREADEIFARLRAVELEQARSSAR